MTEAFRVFDRALVRRHRDRAAENFAPNHSVLFEEIADHIRERLGDVKREFKNTLDLGAHNRLLAKQLANKDRLVVATDLSQKMLAVNANIPSAVVDEELLTFAPQSFDLVLSNLSLHWVNDLPGSLAQIRQLLRPNGLFLASLLGGNTLIELRTSLLEAELAVNGGISPRLSPSIDMQTASALLQRAGFHLPVTDQENITLTYSNIFALMRDLRGMGEGNKHVSRLRTPTRRKIFELADEIYRQRFGSADGILPATFNVIFLHGWNESQT